MTFPIRPVPPVGGVPRVRKEDDPKLAAAAMVENPDKATSLLRGLLVQIDNVDRPHGLGTGSDSKPAADRIRSFVEGPHPSCPPTHERFATLLLSVRILEKDVRTALEKTLEPTGASPADIEAKRKRLQEALLTAVKVRRFHGM